MKMNPERKGKGNENPVIDLKEEFKRNPKIRTRKKNPEIRNRK